MKALEPVPTEIPQKIVDELDFLRLHKAGEDSRTAASTVSDLQLRQQMLAMKVGMCDMTKQALQSQLKDLQAEEHKMGVLQDRYKKVFSEGVEAEFRAKYAIPEKSTYSVNPITRELTIN